MKPNKVTETTIEAPMADIKKLKATNSIAKDDVVKVVPDNQKTGTSNASVTTGIPMTEDIEPQDPATIKYLSNVKDDKGEISKPFNLDGKNYQMIRGIKPSKEIVMAVYCLDELNEAGENVIHPVDYFEENIAKPFKLQSETKKIEKIEKKIPTAEFNDLLTMDETGTKEIASSDEIKANNDNFIDYLNLTDLTGFNHFFVNIQTGDVVQKFKTTKEMIKSGIKLGPHEDYMDAKGLKRFRFGNYFKNDMNEGAADDAAAAGTNIPKLQSDVKKLANLIKTKFSIYLNKLDKPIEQAQFLSAMAQEIGVPLNKLSAMITQFKDIAVKITPTPAPNTTPAPTATGAPATNTSVTESKKMTKNELIESVTNTSASVVKRIIKTVKIKDIK